MSDINNKFSIDVYHWTYINFLLQSFLLQHSSVPKETIKKALNVIGYERDSFDTLDAKQKWSLMQENGFFGPFQTGNRIVTFALKASGLNKDMFHCVQEDINSAYETILLEYGENELFEASFRHTLKTLSVFRP
jgi:hypothetical protein